MFIVAITGGIATGKSTVSKVFESKGIPVIDADKIARDIVKPGTSTWYKIREVFGEQVFHPTKELNRLALGQIIFSDKEKRYQLNKITHPVIHRTIFIEIFKNFMKGRSWIVLDLPLLFETNILIDFIYKIIVVSCDQQTQLERLLSRNEYNEEDARKRIESQMPLEQKCEKSHFVVDNSGKVEDTEEQALRIYEILNESNHHWFVRVSMLGLILGIVLILSYAKKLFHMFS